ncbi:hypothetical protein HPB51_027497 [Rhipicephalus microplus]|uniref:Uncharacterized protein n=1 Tax=Rhipicephalus microplus TaxID=6941 RepID=A0A9J6D075_RHIMP|nr:hypothetical protein HPB51_027497 [Rhipicephalus microplus]
MGHDLSSVDSTSSGVACSPKSLADTAAVNVTAVFAATCNNSSPTTLVSSRDHQPLLTMEAEATLAKEAEVAKASTLQYFLIGILFARRVIAAILPMANAIAGSLLPPDLLPEEEQCSGLQRSRYSHDVLKHTNASGGPLALDDRLPKEELCAELRWPLSSHDVPNDVQD